MLQLSPEQTPMWEPSSEPFTVEIRDPEKKKKFKGMKSFTAYRIVPSVREMRGGEEGGRREGGREEERLKKREDCRRKEREKEKEEK